MEQNKIQIMKDMMYNNKKSGLSIYLVYKVWKGQSYSASL